MYILYWQPTLDICWTSQFLLSAGNVCPASHVVFTFVLEKCALATLSARRMNGQDRRKMSIKRRRQEEGEEGGEGTESEIDPTFQYWRPGPGHAPPRLEKIPIVC